MDTTNRPLGVTPWYERNEAANRAHLARLAYERAVREGVGVPAARTAMQAATQAYEAAQGGIWA